MNKFTCKHLNLLTLFLAANVRTKKSIIRLSEKQFLELLVEIILNTLNGNIEIVQKDLKARLVKQKTLLRAIGNGTKKTQNTATAVRTQLLKLLNSLTFCVQNFCSTKQFKQIHQLCLHPQRVKKL